MGFEFAHRGRTGPETIRLSLIDLGGDGVAGGGNDTLLFAKEYTDGLDVWGFYNAAGEPEILALGNTIRFAVESLVPGSAGNFLDAVAFGANVGVTLPHSVPDSPLGCLPMAFCLGVLLVGAQYRRRLALFAVGMLCAGISPSHAVTIIGNYPQANDDTYLTVTAPSVSFLGGVQWAVSFVMPGSDYDLSSVTLRLLAPEGAVPEVTLWNDAGGGGPGPALLVAFSNPPLGAPISDFTFLPTSSTTLTAHMKYWLLVDSLLEFWPFAWIGSNPGIIPSGVASFEGDSYSTDNGVSYQPSSTIPAYFTGTFRIEGEIKRSVPDSPLGMLTFIMIASIMMLPLRRHLRAL